MASVVGHQLARHILLLSEVVTPELTLESGLIDRLSGSQAKDAATSIVDQLLALSQYSILSMKQTIRLSENGAVGHDLADHERLVAAFRRADLNEGMTAFL